MPTSRLTRARGWAIERAVVGECAGSYFVEIGPQQRTIQMWRHANVAEWTDRRAKLAAHSGWRAFRAAQGIDRLGIRAPVRAGAIHASQEPHQRRRFRRDARL